MINFLNVGLTIAGLLLVFLYYFPLLKETAKSPRTFILYILFWLILLILITSLVSYFLFPEISYDDLFKSNNSVLET